VSDKYISNYLKVKVKKRHNVKEHLLTLATQINFNIQEPLMNSYAVHNSP